MTDVAPANSKVPVDWSVKRIDEVARVTTGSRNTQDRVIDGLFPFFVRSQDVEWINSWSYDGEAVLTAGDGVGTGKVFHYINGKFDCHQRVYRIAEFDGAIDGFFFFKQFSQNFYDRIMSMTAKSSVDSVRREMIAGMEIAVPPVEEQRRISQALSDIDDLIASLDSLIAKKRDIKQGAMQQLLTGKRRLPGFSGEWVESTLGELAQIYDGTHQTPRYVAHGVPFYSVEHVTSGNFSDTKFISEEEHKLLTRRIKIQRGDVLMTRIGSIGDCKLVDWDVNASFYVSLALLKFREESHAEYFTHYSKTDEFRVDMDLHSLAHAIPKKINLGPIAHVRVKLPPTGDEQRAIANVLSDMDLEISASADRLFKANFTKQGMMQQLLTGRIRLI
jgi:type I restriction enzyme S subunit